MVTEGTHTQKNKINKQKTKTKNKHTKKDKVKETKGKQNKITT